MEGIGEIADLLAAKLAEREGRHALKQVDPGGRAIQPIGSQDNGRHGRQLVVLSGWAA